MKNYRRILTFFFLSSIAFSSAFTQSLPEVESQLSALAKEVLMKGDLDQKIKQNKQFAKLLFETLKRPESYSYPFDSVTTVSILSPEDKSFRIFTWYIVDRDQDVIRGEQYHYYFGLVQRRYTDPQGKEQYLVIPLLEMPQITPAVENMSLDNSNWLGALYYLPRFHEYLPKYSIKTYSPRSTIQDSIYVLGEGWQSGDKSRKQKRDVYLLMGWNGNDDQTNYKLVDVLSFDPNDPERVIFGAGIFYFDKQVSKQRAIFEYSDNAPFSLNMSYIKSGLMGREEVIVFDHLGQPNSVRSNPASSWDMGPDGSYDALSYSKKYGGFRWYRNVNLDEKYNRKLQLEAEANQEKIIRARLAEAKRWAEEAGDQEMVAEIEQLEKKPNLGKSALNYLRQSEKDQLKAQQALKEAEENKLKEAGIDLDKGSKKDRN